MYPTARGPRCSRQRRLSFSVSIIKAIGLKTTHLDAVWLFLVAPGFLDDGVLKGLEEIGWEGAATFQGTNDLFDMRATVMFMYESSFSYP